MRSAPPPIEIDGAIILDVGSGFNSSSPVLSNVYGFGTISVRASGLDSLYVPVAIFRDGNVYIQITRETDYQKIFNDGRGAFINAARSANPGNRAVAAFDRAANMDELQSLMSRSAMFNPIKLMRPIRIFNQFAINQDQTDNVVLEPIYIFGEGLEIYAASGSVGINSGEWTFRAKGYIGEFTSSDELDDFNGKFYGGNVSAIWTDETLWIDATAGLSISQFQTDGIYDGSGAAIFNPDGIASYGNFDAGAKFDSDGFYISPFIGIGVRGESVLYQNELEIYFRGGASAGWSETTGGLKYNYEVFAIGQTDNVQIGGARIGVWSVADSAGGEFSYSLILDDPSPGGAEAMIAHKFSIGGKFRF
jgi:hypothetical protein